MSSDREIKFLALALHAECDVCVDLPAHQGDDLLYRHFFGDRLPVYGDQHVAFLHTRFLRRHIGNGCQRHFPRFIFLQVCAHAAELALQRLRLQFAGRGVEKNGELIAHGLHVTARRAALQNIIVRQLAIKIIFDDVIHLRHKRKLIASTFYLPAPKVAHTKGNRDDEDGKQSVKRERE